MNEKLKRCNSLFVKSRCRRISRKMNSNSSSIKTVPEYISRNHALVSAISKSLPPEYEFEIPKTIWRIEQIKAKHILLQMPEGLLAYSCIIADLLSKFSSASAISILSEVTYGACCIDDLGAKELGADLLVHYGHSCLVPLTVTEVPCLYVFVEITIDVYHLVDCLCKTLTVGTRVHVMGTVQFRGAIIRASKLLTGRGRPASVPQVKPLSPGEVLGCTAPKILGSAFSKSDESNAHENKHVILFISDGRFHMEAVMIANPSILTFRYDPYAKRLTHEKYELARMKSIREDSIKKSMLPSVKNFGIIFGTLGRQGNAAILEYVCTLLLKHGKKYFVLLLNEISPQKLDLFSNIDVWVQISCPRLSVDWGHYFNQPLLTSYELSICLGEGDFNDIHPMDFYSNLGGRWANYNNSNKSRKLLHGFHN